MIALSTECQDKLKKILFQENFTHAQCKPEDQLITNKLNTLDHSQLAPAPAEPCDFIVSSRGKYKVFQSCLEFQKLLYKNVEVAREVSYLYQSSAGNIQSLVKQFNSVVLDLILGQGAHKSG